VVGRWRQQALEVLEMEAQCLEETTQAMVVAHDRPVSADVSHLDDLNCMLEGPAVLSGSVRLA
jgi:hypothetical protein